jgi:hypothetical protein
MQKRSGQKQDKASAAQKKKKAAEDAKHVVLPKK